MRWNCSPDHGHLQVLLQAWCHINCWASWFSYKAVAPGQYRHDNMIATLPCLPTGQRVVSFSRNMFDLWQAPKSIPARQWLEAREMNPVSAIRIELAGCRLSTCALASPAVQISLRYRNSGERSLNKDHAPLMISFSRCRRSVEDATDLIKLTIFLASTFFF